jgi:hypothetical protein
MQGDYFLLGSINDTSVFSTTRKLFRSAHQPYFAHQAQREYFSGLCSFTMALTNPVRSLSKQRGFLQPGSIFTLFPLFVAQTPKLSKRSYP